MSLDWGSIVWTALAPASPGYYAAKDASGFRRIVTLYTKGGKLRVLGFGSPTKLLWGPLVVPLPPEGA